MKSRILSIICKITPIICSFAIAASTMATNECKRTYYQEKEPDNLADFSKRQSSTHMIH